MKKYRLPSDDFRDFDEREQKVFHNDIVDNGRIDIHSHDRRKLEKYREQRKHKRLMKYISQ